MPAMKLLMDQKTTLCRLVLVSNTPFKQRFPNGILRTMRKILETEEHVPIPPALYADPFYRISYLIKEEIRKYKWVEGEKGRKLTWEKARQEWTGAYREK